MSADPWEPPVDDDWLPPEEPPEEPDPFPPAEIGQDRGGHSLKFHTIPELRDRAAARGPRTWLARGWWPHGAYGVHGAEPKAQKSWNALDLGVSVASGTPWLGHIPIDTTGPVLVFAGEGGETSILRRIEGIAASRNVDAGDLHIVVCARAPHLADVGHMQSFHDALQHHQPALVLLDPLYLSAKGAKLGDIYSMGALLEIPQHLCEDAKASLFVVHHNNRSATAKGSGRFSGAGPAEWGRVLISGTVISRHREPGTGATRVLTELELIGGEVADRTLRINRRIQADDPDDLDSRLAYEVTATDVQETGHSNDKDDGMPPARSKILEAARAGIEPQTSRQLVDRIAKKHGHGLKRETVSRHLNALSELDLIDCLNPDAPAGEERLWTPTNPV